MGLLHPFILLKALDTNETAVCSSLVSQKEIFSLLGGKQTWLFYRSFIFCLLIIHWGFF